MSVDTDTPPVAPPTPGRVLGNRRLPRLGRTENVWIGLILLLLVGVFPILSPPGTFLTCDNATSILLDASELLILASGMTFLLIAAGLDLSIGSVAVFFAGAEGGGAHRLAGTPTE